MSPLSFLFFLTIRSLFPMTSLRNNNPVIHFS
jgi:hypothetical protein